MDDFFGEDEIQEDPEKLGLTQLGEPPDRDPDDASGPDVGLVRGGRGGVGGDGEVGGGRDGGVSGVGSTIDRTGGGLLDQPREA